MSAVYPTLPKLAVRDSIDEDDLTDIDDEVFIRDGRNGGLKLDDDGGVKRPLMAPRRKCKKACNFETRKFPCRALLVPFCYGLTALIVLLGLIVLCIFTANIFPMPITILKNWLSQELKETIKKSDVVPCTSLASKIMWTRSLPKLTSEAPLRSNDVNKDGIEDIIVGFSTGLDTLGAPEYLCNLYFGGQTPCLGGVLALDGKTGETLWTHWTAHAIFSVDCALDLTDDKVKDCVISGRGGVLHALSGHDGSSIWEVRPEDFATFDRQRMLDVYDAKFIADVDGDGVGDVIASHAVQSGGIRSSEILIISGKTGNIMRTVKLPDTEQLFLAPQILIHPDGENIFILATSSREQAGGLYITSQMSLMYGDLKLRKLHHDTGKGVLLPPILADITSDGVEDIIAAMFNSTIMAYNGITFKPIWNYTVPNSEVISIPIPGYYNDDDVPDFMVKHQIGAGFPTYYYTVATIIDGRNGKPLLEKPIEDSLSKQMSGLSITVDGFGNDWFLHWSADCLNHEGVKEKYQFLKGQSIASQMHADLCKLRFNSTLTRSLLALSQHVGPPGILLYFSEDWKSVEFNNSIDPRKEAEKYLDTHRNEVMDTYADIPFVSERSPKIRKGHRKENIFKHKGNNVLSELNKYPYDNSREYKNHEKDSSSNFNNENADTYNGDENWKHTNKWIDGNPQVDKEYDASYDDDDNDGNGADEQSLEYPQMDEVREQRSDTDDDLDVYEFDSDVNDNEEKLNNPTTTDRIKESEVIDNNTSSFNVNQEAEEVNKHDTTFIRKRHTREIEKERSFIAVINLLMRSAKRTRSQLILNRSNRISNPEHLRTSRKLAYMRQQEEIKLKTTHMPHIETVSTTASENTTVSEHLTQAPDLTQTSSVTDSTVDYSTETLIQINETEINERNFSNIIDQDEDAKLEQIFKQESLKNQNQEEISKKLNISNILTDQSQTKLRKKRTKRKSSTENERAEADGIQRQPPTGILLPPLVQTKGKTAVDLVFSTFWLPASEISVILLQDDLDCIHRKKALSEKKVQYKENDEIISECLLERGVNYKTYQESMDRENVKISLGQMTIYRMRLECVCPEDMLPTQTCRNISSQQSWPEHLGSFGNGYFKPAHRQRV